MNPRIRRLARLPTALPALTTLTALLLTLTITADAQAWVQTQTCIEGGGQFACDPGQEPQKAYWPHRGIYYHINELGSENFALGADGSIDDPLLQAIRDSFEVWNEPVCSNLTFVYAGLTSVDVAAIDDPSVNVVTWLGRWPTDLDPAYSRAAYALTSVNIDPRNGKIVDVDIELNDELFTFANLAQAAPMSDQVDVRNTLVHEIGHFLGLDHSNDRSSTMFASAPIGEVSKRTLSDDDLDGLCAIYTDDGSTPQFTDPALAIPDESSCSCRQLRQRPTTPHNPAPLALAALALGLLSHRKRGPLGR